MKKNMKFYHGILLLVLAILMLSIPGWLKNYDGFEGYVLVASPELEDPNFRQTVILITEHNPMMAKGYVLNRLQFDPEYATYQRWGGPLAPDHVRIFTKTGGANAMAIADTGFYLKPQDPLYDRSEDDIFLHGYAAWGWGHLEDEIAAGNWQALPFTPEMLEISFTTMWQDVWDKTQ